MEQNEGNANKNAHMAKYAYQLEAALLMPTALLPDPTTRFHSISKARKKAAAVPATGRYLRIENRHVGSGQEPLTEYKGGLFGKYSSKFLPSHSYRPSSAP